MTSRIRHRDIGQEVLRALEELSNLGEEFFYTYVAVSKRVKENVNLSFENNSVKAHLEAYADKGEIERAIIPSFYAWEIKDEDREDIIAGGDTSKMMRGARRVYRSIDRNKK